MFFDALCRSTRRKPLAGQARAAALLLARLIGSASGIGIALGIGAAPAAAHDMWMLPSHFTPAVGDLVEVRLRIGHAGSEDVVYRKPQRIVRFAAFGPASETPVLGLEGTDPAGYLSPAESGLYTLVYESNTTFSQLDGPKFERYLHEEGLDSIIAARAARGAGDRPGRERYARSLKSLIRVGEGVAIQDQAQGLPLELVLESDLGQLADGGGVAAGRDVTFRLYYRGAPLAGALVGCRPLEAAEEETARTDDNGRVRFPLAAGTWLVTAVHMVPTTAEDAEWLSVWTALTFQLPAASSSGQAR